MIGLMIFFVTILIIGGFTAIMITISKAAQSDRAAKLKMLAQQWGFYFTENPVVPDFLCNTRFAQSGIGIGCKMHNLIQGNVNGTPIFIFDWGYNSNYGGRVSSTHRQTVVCIPMGSNQPFSFFQDNQIVAPENIQMFINQALNAYNYQLSGSYQQIR